jgi:hypothetical protein
VTRPDPVMTRQIGAIGLGVSRSGLAFLLVLIGSYKFFTFEAEARRPSSGHLKLPSALSFAPGVGRRASRDTPAWSPAACFSSHCRSW